MRQLSLFGAGHAAKVCSQQAHEESKRTRETRQQQILRLLSVVGHDGLTRYELAKLMGTESSAICAAVLALLDIGAVVELADCRTNPTGHAACILILPCWLDGRPLS